MEVLISWTPFHSQDATFRLDPHFPDLQYRAQMSNDRGLDINATLEKDVSPKQWPRKSPLDSG